ncbi:MAG TPA: rod shape-determining protein MreC [Candidatus Acidoferrales bacterium]
MLPFASRHRPLVLLAVVLAVQVLLLAVQIRREQDVRLIRVWAVGITTLAQKPLVWLADRVGGAWSGYVDLRDTRGENERLRAENDALKLRLQQLEGTAAEAQRLARLVEFREAHPELPSVVARVIAASPVAGSRSVFINRGAAHGVEKNMGVITPDGVVGKVLEAYLDTSQVLLISDKEMGVGALLESARTQGVVRGSADPWLWMHYVVNEEVVNAGERILTSGQDRIFPRDLPVGTVRDVQPGSPFKSIRVQPAARLDRLEEVLVLMSRPSPELPDKK